MKDDAGTSGPLGEGSPGLFGAHTDADAGNVAGSAADNDNGSGERNDDWALPHSVREALPPWLARSLPVAPNDGIPDWLNFHARATPERTALVADGREWTYGELDTEVSSIAQRLASLGVMPGHRVATCLHNSAFAGMLPHAILRLRATLVPLNVRLGDAELLSQLAGSGAGLLVVDSDTAARFAHRATAGGIADVVFTAREAACRQVAETLGIPVLEDIAESEVELSLMHDPRHTLAVIHTSGTTGAARGAMLSVGNFWWSAIGSALNIGVQPDDRWLASLPLFHVGGLSIVTRAAIYGIAAEIHSSFDAATVNAAIDHRGVSIVSVVAVMLQRMLDERGERPVPASLRCVLLGGGPAPGPLLERSIQAGIPVAQTYGLTETTSQVATLAPQDALRKLGSAGRAIWPNQIRIGPPAGDTAGEADAEATDVGEILVRGPVVMQGYLGMEVESQAVLDSGWLRTGDMGFLDADGYLYVLDRRSDLIITGGENVYPAEVESALLSHPAVLEAGVIGLPDATWGKRVAAVVLLRGEMQAPKPVELREHCRLLLAGYKVPGEILVTSTPLPRTASGKLRRAELRARYIGT